MVRFADSRATVCGKAGAARGIVGDGSQANGAERGTRSPQHIACRPHRAACYDQLHRLSVSVASRIAGIEVLQLLDRR